MTNAALDRILIADVIQRERAARDAGLWEEMAACWHRDSSVDVSWFKGNGADFTAASKKNAGGSTLSFHQMSPSVVTVHGSRALADTGCAVHGSRVLAGDDVVVVSHTRLLSRALYTGEQWLLAGLRVVYLCDFLLPREPGRAPALDQNALQTFRSSYKYLSYILTQSGHVPRLDLPGVDDPQSVRQLRETEKEWLYHSTATQN